MNYFFTSTKYLFPLACTQPRKTEIIGNSFTCQDDLEGVFLAEMWIVNVEENLLGPNLLIDKLPRTLDAI